MISCMQQIPKTIALPVTPMTSGPRNSSYALCSSTMIETYEEQLSIRKARVREAKAGESGGSSEICQRVKGQKYK